MYASIFAFPLLMGPYQQKSQKVDLLLHFKIWEHSKRRMILVVLLWKLTFPMLKIPWKLFCLGFRLSNMEYKMRERGAATAGESRWGQGLEFPAQINPACPCRQDHTAAWLQLCQKANTSQPGPASCICSQGVMLTQSSELPVPDSRATLTFHFGVGLPLVEPAPEGFAVVLCTLQGSEVQAACWARLLIAKLIHTAGTLAELPTVLRPTKKREKDDFAKSPFCVIGMLHVCENTGNRRGDSALGDQCFLYGPLIFMVPKTKQSNWHELSTWIAADSAKMQPSRGESCLH